MAAPVGLRLILKKKKKENSLIYDTNTLAKWEAFSYGLGGLM